MPLPSLHNVWQTRRTCTVFCKVCQYSRYRSVVFSRRASRNVSMIESVPKSVLRMISRISAGSCIKRDCDWESGSWWKLRPELAIVNRQGTLSSTCVLSKFDRMSSDPLLKTNELVIEKCTGSLHLVCHPNRKALCGTRDRRSCFVNNY